MWNVYLNEELKFTSTSPFIDLNDQAFKNWDFSHVDPTGAKQLGMASLYTAGDLAAAMAVNPSLRVFSSNGYYDAVTPFFQTILTFEAMPVASEKDLERLTVRNFASGHMVYLDNDSRTAMKGDLAAFYEETRTVAKAAAKQEVRDLLVVRQTRYRRRLSRTPY
jgi:carboxypeptidase C (cathepsin A)